MTEAASALIYGSASAAEMYPSYNALGGAATMYQIDSKSQWLMKQWQNPTNHAEGLPLDLWQITRKVQVYVKDTKKIITWIQQPWSAE